MTSKRNDGFHQAVKEFLLETHENLEQVENELVELERNPSHNARSSELVGNIFRVLHSLKGSCGFLGYPKLEELAHVGENLLSRIRDGTLPLSPAAVTAMLSVVDAIREILEHIENESAEGDRDYSNLAQQLSLIYEGDDGPVRSLADRPSAPLSGESAASQARDLLVSRRPTARPDASIPPPSRPSDSASAAYPTPESTPSRSVFASLDLSRPCDLPGGSSSLDDRTPGPDSGGSSPRPTDRLSDATLRVDLALMDKMMALAGELVLTRNQILQDSPAGRDRLGDRMYRQLNMITSELQGCIMKSRMQPISRLWKQFPRVVRDVALGSFKQVRLELEGSETELDKTIIEAIRDPLVHVLRNAVGHGIELPELRVALGKPAEGRIWLRAYHAGGQISIEVADDGGGIDPQAIRQRVIEHNLVPSAQLARMNEQDLLPLIFQPGFSTAKTITRLSGRGVGLNVVRASVEKLGGTIDVQSTIGEGTSITLRIPLTLAIIQAILVKSAGERYALPLSRVVELMRFEGDEARRLVEIAYGASNYRYRGRWLPIVRLDRLLEQADGGSPEVVNLVVLKAHGRHYGLVVDQVIDNQEIVVKPLWQPLREITVYAGATQLADGDVALILDPIGLARRAGLVPELREASPMESRSIEAEAQEPLPRVLVAEGPWGGRIALPIDGLTRIRNVLYSQMTIIEDRLLLEHEGRILQLIDVGSALAAGAAPGCPKAQSRADLAEGRTHVVIYSSQDKSVGLIVGQVLDIVDHASEVRGDPTRSHVQFTTMIDESVVELLDIEGIIRAADPGFFPDPLPVAVGG